MPSIIARYYQGILQQVRSEVDLINTLFQHQGIKGEGNETILRDLVRRFIPQKYGVGTGIVIDQDGNCSNQIDIIIYDTFLYPSLLTLTSVHLFPVDVVYATIEVKTTLDSTKAKEALDNIASVRNLHFIREGWMTPYIEEGAPTTAMHLEVPPMGFVFAYNSAAQQFATFKNWFPPADEKSIASPTLVACLDQGILSFDDPDNLIFEPKVPRQVQAVMIPLQDEAGNFIEVAEEVESYAYNGIIYPVKKHDAKCFAIDQGRVLLLFMLYLHEALSYHEKNPKISFREQYFKGEGIGEGIEI